MSESITEDFVSFETAKLLKEKGFDAPVKNYYSLYTEDVKHNLQKKYGAKKNWNSFDLTISRPSQSLAMKWLREKYKLNVEVCLNAQGYEGIITTVFNGVIKITNTIPVSKHSIYEESCEAAIRYCLENMI